MRELGRLLHKAGAATPAVEVSILPGVPAEADAAAANANPAHAFLRAAWFAATGEAASTLVAKRPDGRVLAALPTVTIRGGFGLGRGVPGCYWPCRSFPIAEDASAAELRAFFADPEAPSVLGPAWRLGPVNEDDPTAARIVPALREAGWHPLRRTLGRAFILDIPALRAENQWPRGSTLRKNRWFEKELAREGALRFEYISGANWNAELFETLGTIEANSWIGERTDCSGAKFIDGPCRRFWEAAARDSELAAMMRVAILHIGDTPAAFLFELTCGGTSYAIANSFDRRFAKNSPGRVLAYRRFERFDAQGITRVDWGAGDPGYKRTMGAEAGPEIFDWLFVRSAAAAALLRPLWR
ncbi:MAG TPA: GNAT family N-acetyltransferase [Allosphingosinicella sp.]